MKKNGPTKKKKSAKQKPQKLLPPPAYILPPHPVVEEKPVIQKQAAYKTIETLSPQPEKMELHHPSAHHPRKFTDYLFEFLMLFLAVVAGFLVENAREHYIENQRAEQFSRQLLADLRLDSVLFENRKRDIEQRQKGYDRLQYLLTEKPGATDKEVLEVLLPTAFAYDVPAVTTTYNQMKSSGALRYIANQELVTHLQTYYDMLLPRSVKITDAALAFFTEHINGFYLKHIRIQDIDPFNDTLKTSNPVLMGRTPQTDQELANIMGGYKSLINIQAITMNEPSLKKIKETITLLKKEYELE